MSIMLIAIAIVLLLLFAWFILQPQQGRIAQNAPRRSRPTLPAPRGKLDGEIRQLLTQGQKIEAIKRVRQVTGWDLTKAKHYVEALSNASPLEPPRQNRPVSLDNKQLHLIVRQLLAQGQKIEAIKRVRQQTGLGLKEAKDYVDQLERSW